MAGVEWFDAAAQYAPQFFETIGDFAHSAGYHGIGDGLHGFADNAREFNRGYRRFSSSLTNAAAASGFVRDILRSKGFGNLDRFERGGWLVKSAYGRTRRRFARGYRGLDSRRKPCRLVATRSPS